jgi:hypothetical protein
LRFPHRSDDLFPPLKLKKKDDSQKKTIKKEKRQKKQAKKGQNRFKILP